MNGLPEVWDPVGQTKDREPLRAFYRNNSYARRPNPVRLSKSFEGRVNKWSSKTNWSM